VQPKVCLGVAFEMGPFAMTRRHFLSACLLIFGSVMGLLYHPPAISATVVHDPAGPRSVEDSYFGMHVRWGATTLFWPKASFHSWRVITGETSWYGLEKEKGIWRFDALDRAVAVAEARGVEVLYTLGYPPKRAVAARYLDAWNPGVALPPQDMTEWEGYVRRVAERYRGRIKYYELMNEPHFTEVDGRHSKVHFPAATMVEMARIASRVIKQIDPEAKLVSMSPSGAFGGVRRVEAFLKAGGGQYVDVLGFHFYAPRAEEIPALVAALRKVMAEAGQSHLPIWNTESGFYIDGPDKPHGKGRRPEHQPLYSPELGAAMVSRALTLGAAAGLRRFYWYSWDIPTMALAYGRGKDINPAGRAYVKTEQWLRGATIKECLTADDQLWVCEVSRGERKARLVWNTTGSREWAVPANGQTRRYETLSGEEGRVGQSGLVHVNEAPLLILSDDEKWGTL
jgi:hypothetical protein